MGCGAGVAEQRMGHACLLLQCSPLHADALPSSAGVPSLHILYFVPPAGRRAPVQVIQLQGDQRKNVLQFLTQEKLVKKEFIKIHGF